MKHDPQTIERVRVIVDEVRKIYFQMPWHDRQAIEANVKKIKELKKEIYALGLRPIFLVEIAKNKTVSVSATVLAPAEDLNPEEQKAYDKWFKMVNGIAPDEDKNNPA